MNLKDSILKNILITNRVNFDNPGILINNVKTRLFGPTIKVRKMYLFEDIFSDLQNLTIKQFGNKNASVLFQKIGRDIGTRSFLIPFYKKQIKYKKLLMDFTKIGMYYAGLSALLHMKIDEKKIVFTGTNNIFCRKTKDPALLLGIMSGILSLIFEKNIKAKHLCKNCPDGCKLIFEIDRTEYKPYIAGFDKIKRSYHLNFFDQFPSLNKSYSLNDLVKFKKVNYLGSKDMFKTNTILLADQFYETFTEHYRKIGKINLLKQGIKSSAQTLAPKILQSKTKKEQLEEIKTILCAFGWGFFYHTLEHNQITITIINPPYSMFGYELYAYELNGYLNYILKKNCKIKKIKSKKNPILVKITYEF